MDYIQSQAQLRQFLREQPNWIRRLNRNPTELQVFELSAQHYYKRTIPHQVEKITSGVQMASMMMSMFQAMNNSAE